MNYTRTPTEPFTGPSRIMEGQRSDASSSWLNNILTRRSNLTNHRLEELIDIDRNLTLFSNEQLNVLNSTRLYGHYWFLFLPMFSYIIGQNLFIFLMEKKKELI